MKKSLFWICLITFILLASTQELSAKNWEYQKSGTASNLTAVSFVDKDHGWAVGENATILATLDGGVNWKILSPELLDQVPAVVSSYSRMCHFRSVCFLDRENGWVAGEITLIGVDTKDIYQFPVQFGRD